ncbi:uncharacterized protein BDR25DRAFT_345069 [Lindgomyces ingoldianus]|uniref:Uncharacterized protein n=1 Tax=Lindgomyces ingoldianus TaxID=673940 RepID=A0ACB6QJZ4_9PLEO|nr:uncharacterized protein BDR25DRAFT_345069 [Lindgomyces ingoldianus]KAF2467329.1 hypothetical protein BDR25DRAFT_345069 [Lindgomyces ingoldianus]
MDVQSIADFALAIGRVAASVFKTLDAFILSGKEFRELQQEIGSLEHALAEITAIERSSDNVVYDENPRQEMGRYKTLRELSQSTLLVDMMSVMRKLEVWRRDMMYSKSPAAQRQEAREWQEKLGELRMKLTVLQASTYLKDNSDGANSTQPLCFSEGDISESQQRQLQGSSGQGVNAGAFKCTFPDGSVYKEIQETTPKYTHLSERPQASAHNYGEIAVSLASAVTSATTAICMQNYSQLHNQWRHGNLHQHMPPLVSLKEPSPAVFVAATIAHGLATFVYYISRNTDRYREWFLGTGALGAMTVGVMTGSGTQGVLARHNRTVGEQRDEKSGALENAC